MTAPHPPSVPAPHLFGSPAKSRGPLRRFRAWLYAGINRMLAFAPKALPFLRGKEKLLMRKYEPKAERKTQQPPTPKTHTDIANAELFELLRSLRRDFAAEQNVPPYVVFADSVLNAMCMRLPRNEGEFLAVPGVGEVKLERYGKRFLEVINEWRRR